MFPDSSKKITLEQYVKFYKSRQFYSLPDRLDKYQQEYQSTQLPDPADLSLHNGMPVAIRVSDIGTDDVKIYYKTDIFTKQKRNNSCQFN